MLVKDFGESKNKVFKKKCTEVIRKVIPEYKLTWM